MCHIGRRRWAEREGESERTALFVESGRSNQIVIYPSTLGTQKRSLLLGTTRGSTIVDDSDCWSLLFGSGVPLVIPFEIEAAVGRAGSKV